MLLLVRTSLALQVLGTHLAIKIATRDTATNAPALAPTITVSSGEAPKYILFIVPLSKIDHDHTDETSFGSSSGGRFASLQSDISSNIPACSR